MRKFCLLFAIVAVTSAICLNNARADEPNSDAGAKQAAKDPNYRYYNGQWWYWMPQQKNWKVWDGNQWNDYVAGQANRSFSYTEGSDTENVGAGVTQMFGAPLRRVPNSVRNRQIIGSYGFHSAGSKAMGNY